MYFSVIRRAPHEFKIACLEVSSLLWHTSDMLNFFDMVFELLNKLLLFLAFHVFIHIPMGCESNQLNGLHASVRGIYGVLRDVLLHCTSTKWDFNCWVIKNIYIITTLELVFSSKHIFLVISICLNIVHHNF